MPQHYPPGVTVQNGQFVFDFDVITQGSIAQMERDGMINRDQSHELLQRLNSGERGGIERFAAGLGGTLARGPADIAKSLLGGLTGRPVESAQEIGGLFTRLLAPGDPSISASSSASRGTAGTPTTVQAFRDAFPRETQTRTSPGFHPIPDEDQFGPAALDAGADAGPTIRTPTGFRDIQVRIMSPDPNTGELFETFDIYRIQTTTDSNGNTTDLQGVEPDFVGNPLLNQATQKFNQGELRRQEDILAKARADTLAEKGDVQSKQDRLAIFDILSTPLGRNVGI